MLTAQLMEGFSLRCQTGVLDIKVSHLNDMVIAQLQLLNTFLLILVLPFLV